MERYLRTDENLRELYAVLEQELDAEPSDVYDFADLLCPDDGSLGMNSARFEAFVGLRLRKPVFLRVYFEDEGVRIDILAEDVLGEEQLAAVARAEELLAAVLADLRRRFLSGGPRERLSVLAT